MAAGPWYTGSGVGDLNIALAPKVINAKLVTSRKNREIFAHPVIQAMLGMDQGLGALLGALGIQDGFVDLGELLLTNSAEGTLAGATNYTATTGATLTPARKTVVRSISDFGFATQQRLLAGEISGDMYAFVLGDALDAWKNTIIDLMGDLASGATHEIGTTGAALTWSALQDGIYDAKDRACYGPFLGLVTAKGAKDLADDGLSLGGAVQMAGQMQQLIPNAGDGAFLGRYFGNTDLYLCDAARLDSDGGDTLGSLWSPGAVYSKHQPVQLPARAQAVVNTELLTVEMLRPGGGVSLFEVAAHLAVGIREQARMAAIRYVT